MMERIPLFPFPDEADWEYRHEVDGLVIDIAKVGGGTPGNKYGGYWHWRIVNESGDVLADSSGDPAVMVHAGAPMSHVGVAQCVLLAVIAAED